MREGLSRGILVVTLACLGSYPVLPLKCRPIFPSRGVGCLIAVLSLEGSEALQEQRMTIPFSPLAELKICINCVRTPV